MTLPVPVKLALTVLGFRGLSKDGDTFNIDMRMELSWTDRRIPWDAGTYTGADAKELLSRMWIPDVSISGDVEYGKELVLIVQRNVAAEEKDFKESDVNITLRTADARAQKFSAKFMEFPF